MSDPGKPRLQKSPWDTLQSKVIHENHWYKLRQDKVLTHTGVEAVYTFVDHPGAVAIVPVTLEGQIVLINQYRYTVKEWCLEVPMGGKLNEDSVQAAERELMEEIGAKFKELEYISSFYASIGTSNIKCEVFLARGVELGRNHPEDTELIEVLVKSKQEVLQMVGAGEITDGMSALSILLSEPYW